MLDFFFFTLHPVIVLNKYCTSKKYILKVLHATTIRKTCVKCAIDYNKKSQKITRRMIFLIVSIIAIFSRFFINVSMLV